MNIHKDDDTSSTCQKEYSISMQGVLCESQIGFSRLLYHFTVNFQNALRFMKLLSDF